MKEKLPPIAFFCFCLCCIILGEIVLSIFLPKQNVTEQVVPTPQSIIQSLPIERKSK